MSVFPLQIDLDDVVAINPELFTSPVVAAAKESHLAQENVTTQVGYPGVFPLILAKQQESESIEF